MNAPEFTRWWTDAKTCFPSLDAWVCKCFQDENRQREFLRKWSGVLSDVQLTDALEVNRQMQTGDLPWVGEYDHDKERLPQHVRRLAMQMSWDRRERPADDPKDLNPTSFPAGKIMRRIIDLTDKGVPPEEAKAIVLKELPVGRPRYEHRFHCLICFDTGLVTVASRTAIEYVLADKFHECHHREAAIRCTCKGHIPQSQKRPFPVYDSSKDFRIEDYLWRPPEVERFMAWVEQRREDYWNSKREMAFDSFNQR